MQYSSFKKIFLRLKDILKRYRASKGEAWAASITFYVMLSLPAVFTVLLSIVRYFIDEKTLGSLLGGFLPQSVYEGSLQAFLSASYAQHVSFSLLFSFIIALFSAGKVFSHLTLALGEVWHFPELILLGNEKISLSRRVFSFFKKRLRDALPLFILALSLILLASFNTLFHLFLPLFSSLFPNIPFLFPLLTSLLFISVSALVCGLFFYLFSAKRFTFRQWSRGGLLTAILLFMGQWGLGIYFRIVDIGNSFGALGSSIILLVWLYYSANIFLLGATAVCSITPKE